MTFVALLSGIVLILTVLELATSLTVGWPILTREKEDTVRKALIDPWLSSRDGLLIHLPDGYVSISWSAPRVLNPLGEMYYASAPNYRSTIRIPRGTKLYKDILRLQQDLKASYKS